MQLSPAPDLGSQRRIVWAALVVTLVVWAKFAIQNHNLGLTLGDTDDALRLTLVRDLLSGRGWYDQLVTRLQPPQGVYMHWSRLLDGAIATVDGFFRLFVSPDAADTATRFVWPLLWIPPAVLAALLVARRVGGAAASFPAAVLMLLNIQLYVQFQPGRVDHHNVQITLCVIAAACAMAEERRARWAAVAGIATGLGLAIGIEALAFHAIIGASYGLRLAFDREQAKPARAYALSLAAATLLFFAIETPPWRWSLSFCDAIGMNLVAAIVAAGIGLAGVSLLARVSALWRFLALAIVGAVAAGLYLSLDPLCIHGPFAAVDPRLKPIWFDRIVELESWPKLFKSERDSALVSIIMAAVSLVSVAVLLVKDWRKPNPAVLLASALVLLAAWAASHAARMQDYMFWFGTPVAAAACAAIAGRFMRNLMIPTALLMALMSPVFLVAIEKGVMKLVPHHGGGATAKAKEKDNASCFKTANYAAMAALPPGIVLGEIDIGPFVLAHTKHSVLSAPYHRMSWGILAAHDALAAPVDKAEPMVRKLNVTYVAECGDTYMKQGKGSLEAELRAGKTPAWLEPLSTPDAAIRMYRVRPVAPPTAG